MLMRTIRRIAYGGAGLFFLYQAAMSFRAVGLTQDSAFPAAMAVLFGVMAVWGKSG